LRQRWAYALLTRSIRSGSDVFTGIPDLDRIGAEYAAGTAISLPGFQRAWKPLGTLASAIEAEFEYPVHTNVYITPGNAAGFTPHYDTHEVFVLQVAGTKHWRIEKPPLPLPHRSQPFDPRGYTPSAPHLELDLAPGDLLYLPRGYIHTTTTSDSFSIHVTLGLTVYTWVELLAEWAQLSRQVPSLRRALPPDFACREEVWQSLGRQLHEVIAAFHQKIDCDALVSGFTQRVRSARTWTQQEFTTDVAMNRLPGSRVDKRS
jgi:ribosomal protein L16 Arg81 hydroxylase